MYHTKNIVIMVGEMFDIQFKKILNKMIVNIYARLIIENSSIYPFMVSEKGNSQVLNTIFNCQCNIKKVNQLIQNRLLGHNV